MTALWMLVVVAEERLFPIVIELPPGTMSNLYCFSADSDMLFSCEEFAVAKTRLLLLRTASTAETSEDEVPVPVKRRIEAVPGV